MNNLKYLGARITRVSPSSDSLSRLILISLKGPADKDTKKKLKAKSTSEEEYELSRFKPLLQTVIEVCSTLCRALLGLISDFQDHVGNRLDTSIFPYVKDSPVNVASTASLRSSTPTHTESLRSAKPSWHRAARPGGNASEVRQRLIVFVAGGMTYSEMRTAYQRSAPLGKDIYIGELCVLE